MRVCAPPPQSVPVGIMNDPYMLSIVASTDFILPLRPLLLLKGPLRSENNNP